MGMMEAQTQRARVHDEPRDDETREQDEQDEIENKEDGADRLEPAKSIRLLTQQRRHYMKGKSLVTILIQRYMWKFLQVRRENMA